MPPGRNDVISNTFPHTGNKKLNVGNDRLINIICLFIYLLLILWNHGINYGSPQHLMILMMNR